MQSHTVEVEVPPGSVPDMLEFFRRLEQKKGDAPDVDTEHGGDGGDDSDDETFIVQLALGRRFKNYVEAEALRHALNDLDGMMAASGPIWVTEGNPLDRNRNPEVRHTFVVFAIRAPNRMEAERRITEVVTDTVPAPFPIATMTLTELARKRDDD